MPDFNRVAASSVILTDVMKVIGLAAQIPTDFAGTNDSIVIELVTMYNQCGNELALLHDWEALHKEWTLTSTGATTYDLPSDFNGFVNGAQWGNTSRLPMVGAISPQIWRMLKAQLAGGAWYIITYRIVNNQLVFFNPPAVGAVFVLDYFSLGWLRDASDPSITRDNMLNSADICLLNAQLVEACLEVRWRSAKGFDVTAAQSRLDDLLSSVRGRDIPAPTLSISPQPYNCLIGYENIPDTGYGA